MLADPAPNEERGGNEGRPESKLVAGSSLEVRRSAFAYYQSFGDDPARPNAPCFADQLSILIADANSKIVCGLRFHPALITL